MEEIVTGSQMKALDKETIEHMGIPSLVLMERAGLAVYEAMKKEKLPLERVLVLCGGGNNGADGVVVARLLSLAGYPVHVCILGKPEHFTEEMKKQVEIGRNYGISFVKTFRICEYTTIVDAVFGVGLSREVSGVCRETIEKVNQFQGQVVAVDIPSGVCADTGKILGCAVKADMTVTFAYKKAGLCFYPGAAYAGKLLTADIGIYRQKEQTPRILACTREDLRAIHRREDGNKGSFGKVLLIAGSKDMSGAAYLCGQAIMKTGAGMLKVCTREENRMFFSSFPEAMLLTYKEGDFIDASLKEGMEWADVIGIGPGLGTSVQAAALLETVLREGEKPLVIDADGLNLLKGREALLKSYKRDVLLTPHLGEFSRLTGISIQQWKEDPIAVTEKAAKALSCTLICKDARTVISWGNGSSCMNLSGNDGMATAGSGDVLTGILLSLLAQGHAPERAAQLGVFLHGLAGDLAAERKGKAAMLASDILEAAGEILKEL